VSPPDFRAWLESVPAVLWAGSTIVSMLVAFGTLGWARRHVRRAGQHVGDLSLGRTPKDRLLTLASLVPAALFWGMVLAGSFHGLVAFGRGTLGWNDGWEYLVPGTLDGVSVTFAMLAFRAVRRRKSPDRCYRVVWCAALASATINFSYEYQTSGNVLAGGYVGLLSLFGMVMFDEFLNQFEEGAQTVRRENPKFGIRWLTWPTNTFLAAVAWRNHPPPEGTPGTVANAVANLERVRAMKRAARQGRRQPVAAGTVPRSTVDFAPAHTGNAAMATPSAGRSRQEGTGGGRRRARRNGGTVPVPASAAKVTEWARIWTAMSASPQIAEAALRSDDVARQHFGCSARQLRHIRYALTSGALQRRAAELGVLLPDTFAETAGQQDAHRR